MKKKFNVTGMTCAACSARVEKVTAQVAGVTKAEVNLLAGSMVVEAPDAGVTESIILAVTKAGYGAMAADGREIREQKSDAPADTAMKEMKNIKQKDLY